MPDFLSFQPMHVDPVRHLLENPEVSDIFINGAQRLYFMAAGKLQQEKSMFLAEKHVRSFAQYWMNVGGRRLDDGVPCGDVDIHFDDCDMRFHAILGALSHDGTIVSMRVHRRLNLSIESMVAAGDLSYYDAKILRQAVRKRRNILVSGATGSGKTTLLNVLINDCPVDERLIIVEDSSEVRTQHPHCISLHARQKNIENRGEITAEELIFQTLRMKPDRLIVGEFRGKETHSLLSAFNTGHCGFATIHANSLKEVHGRLETLCLLAHIPEKVAVKYAYHTFDIYVHMRREKGVCRVVDIRHASLRTTIGGEEKSETS